MFGPAGQQIDLKQMKDYRLRIIIKKKAKQTKVKRETWTRV